MSAANGADSCDARPNPWLEGRPEIGLGARMCGMIHVSNNDRNTNDTSNINTNLNINIDMQIRIRLMHSNTDITLNINMNTNAMCSSL